LLTVVVVVVVVVVVEVEVVVVVVEAIVVLRVVTIIVDVMEFISADDVVVAPFPVCGCVGKVGIVSLVDMFNSDVTNGSGEVMLISISWLDDFNVAADSFSNVLAAAFFSVVPGFSEHCCLIF
jgi:hypothetical protein